MSLFDEVVGIVCETLQLNGESRALTRESPLLGAIPEFDSMAVVTVLTAIEEQFGIIIDDDEVDAEVFETVGSLAGFVEQKL